MGSNFTTQQLIDKGFHRDAEGNWSRQKQVAIVKNIHKPIGRPNLLKAQMELHDQRTKDSARYSKEDNEYIRQCYSDGIPTKDIATKLGRSQKAIITQAYRLKITLPNDYTKEEKKIILDVYLSNKGKHTHFLSELATKLGRSKQNIARYARSLGLTEASRKSTVTKTCLQCGTVFQKRGHYRGVFCSRKCNNDFLSVSTERRISENGHPKGMLGKKHTEELKVNMAVKTKQRWDSMSEVEKDALVTKQLKNRLAKSGSLAVERKNVSWKQGWRTIGGIRKYFRSRWEANYARYLQFLLSNGEIQKWEHEPETFWFDEIQRGVRSYLPDFKVTLKNNTVEYHEVKGWMDDRSITKIKRMAKYYPHVKLIIIDKHWFKANGKIVSKIVEGWE